MMAPQIVTYLAAALLALVPGSTVAQGTDASGWRLQRSAAADLWYHGLAVIGFGTADGVNRYSPEYADHIRAVKADRNVPPSQLDDLAADLLRALEQDAGFQVLHGVPLYLASASREEMFAILNAVVLEGYGAADMLTDDTRSGFDAISRALRAPRQRRVLQVLLQALDDEWNTFYGSYWDESVAATAEALNAARSLWAADIEPAMAGFLSTRGLSDGIALLSPALSHEGKLYEADPGINAIATWLPAGDWASDRSVYAVVKELCTSVIDDVMHAPDVDRSQEARSRTAVRCGERVLAQTREDLAEAYSQVFVGIAGEAASDLSLTAAYPIGETLEEALETVLAMTESVASGAGSPFATRGWEFKPSESTDLWFHTLAVIAADQPGPLALYSAEYVSHIRDVKRELGVYPTALDSVASALHDRLTAGWVSEIIHFLPVYFPTASTAELLERVTSPGGPDFIRAVGRPLDAANLRLLAQLGDAMKKEWDVFYRDYWASYQAENRRRYAAVQEFWDTALGRLLAPFLEERGLRGGRAIPSAPVGPEGRVINPDPFDARDQVVVVRFPLTANTPEVSNFFFLKELCFLLIEDNAYGRFGRGTQDFDNLRRTGAVRCGAMILDEYAPVLAMQYRRTFLDAVGADESATMEAFDRVYYLDPLMLARLRAQITLPR